jgi:hypothetical protein
VFTLLFATLLSAAAPDPARTALQHIVAASHVADGCDAAQARRAVAEADLSRLGVLDGRPVVLASLAAGCMCGTVNCPWFAFTAGPGEPRVLLSTSAFSVQPFGAPAPLPQLRERAHDSALITDESVDALRNGRYAIVETARVRGDTGERKVDGVPIRFAAGASSARLRGRVSLGWYDDYIFDAGRGQRLLINDVASRAHLDVRLFTPGSSQSIEVTPGVALPLPAGGTFTLHVENGSASDRPPVGYALTLTIR